jgi:putative Mg2+ transporter-C (MgtC) family protein
MTLPGELLIRLVVGTVLGGVIGYERDVHGRPAGLRTHLIVALASTTFMLVSHFVYFQHYTKDDLVTVDTSRIAASVVTGIGFLGGGAILRTGLSVQGLTTAAGLWLVAAIGLSAGAGMYVVSVAATLFGVVALAVLRRFEHKDERLVRRKISLVLTEDGPSVPALLGALAGVGVVVSPAEYDRRVDDYRVHVTLQAQVPVGGQRASGRPARVAARPRARAGRADHMSAGRRPGEERPGR